MLRHRLSLYSVIRNGLMMAGNTAKLHSFAHRGVKARTRSLNFAMKRGGLRGFANQTQSTGKIVPFKLADIGEGITEAEVLQWFVKVGDEVKAFDPVCEVQSDKATVEIPSRYDGVIAKLHYKVGDVAHVGKPLLDIRQKGSGGLSVDEDDAEAIETSAAGEEGAPAVASHDPSSPRDSDPSGAPLKPLATPAVRAIAKTNGIDLKSVQGSGRGGRIMKEDLLRYVGKSPVLEEVPSQTLALQADQHKSEPDQREEDVHIPIRGYTRAMIKTMQAQSSIPHFGFSEDYEIDRLVELKALLAREKSLNGVKLTYMPFLIKSLSQALLEFPEINSSLSADLNNIIHRKRHNVGIAVDSPSGLVVPNIKNVQELSIVQIAEELARLTNLARANKLSKEDISGGTITLSNIGTIGGTYTSPILNPGEAVIGAIGKIEKQPYIKDGTLKERTIIRISWAADHRILAGASIARFSNRFKEILQEPSVMLLSLR
ncbi:hypothetical protein GUITHDRAFT_94276 [Guillardia theta CCMP2712]|uniref:Dihydrolipoamide acetyltransferase component of pyruvate dehydrogenase complex n=1 Tax=Guillardia theta (strain CCMP2712) TaxID=905079 RepID=L1JDN4_GUITC|nr:hypothetical protein GUITHDRAFT_94276 [Guillardia theta CCMP2712]EKX46402.1 hypothetical protein GUITHDRAFT_94276 [Guillardia theta CCMP2712]|eukprot:XP_005833382.1 hypothetical protein GUITHDRAFT_94276 [Guillardia theta CCMP2712]